MFLKLFTMFFALILWSGNVFSQIAEGMILYEYRIDMHRNIPPDREEMKAMIPQYRTTNYQLFFNQDERLYKMEEVVDAMPPQGGRGGRMNFRMPKTEIYLSMADNQRTVSTEFLNKTYLIIDTLSLGPWKLGSELMDILGHRCQMAWYKDTITGEEITAWFTFGIQPMIGPDLFGTLPGTILALDINNGERVWVARKVETRPLLAEEKSKPSRGEKITRAEYNKLVEEQRERMRNTPGMRF